MGILLVIAWQPYCDHKTAGSHCACPELHNVAPLKTTNCNIYISLCVSIKPKIYNKISEL